MEPMYFTGGKVEKKELLIPFFKNWIA